MTLRLIGSNNMRTFIVYSTCMNWTNLASHLKILLICFLVSNLFWHLMPKNGCYARDKDWAEYIVRIQLISFLLQFWYFLLSIYSFNFALFLNVHWFLPLLSSCPDTDDMCMYCFPNSLPRNSDKYCFFIICMFPAAKRMPYLLVMVPNKIWDIEFRIYSFTTSDSSWIRRHEWMTITSQQATSHIDS